MEKSDGVGRIMHNVLYMSSKTNRKPNPVTLPASDPNPLILAGAGMEFRFPIHPLQVDTL